MQNRRDFLALSGAGLVVPLAGCADKGMDDYEIEVALQRAPLSTPVSLLELVRYATLAANGHNTQPWHFSAHERGIDIRPDLTRATPIVDPDDHHLYVSLGCAAENLLISADATGRPAAMEFDPVGEGRIRFDLSTGQTRQTELFNAIPARQSTRSEYDGRKVPRDSLKALEEAALVEGVSLRLFTDEADLEHVLDFVVQGNSDQVDDPEFVKELLEWIRFNPADAIRTGDGLFTATSGNPVLPAWVGRPLFGWFFDKDTENAKYVSQLRSSAGVVVFTGDREDKEHWVKVGRAFQRFALQATALGIRTAHINQPVEIPEIRTEFARWLGEPEVRPDLVIRFGYAPPLPMSLRRPVDRVIVAPVSR